MDKPCPICSEPKHRNLVVVCPICGAEGGAVEIDEITIAFLHAFEVQRDREMDPETFGTPLPPTD